MTVNKVILVGNLGRDPELKQTQLGDSLTKLSVATSESWKDKQTGQRKERTEWHRVVIFGKLAEIAHRYLSKGSKVYLEGELRTRKWVDQSGADRYSTEVVLPQYGGVMKMLGDGNGGNGDAQASAPAGAAARAQAPIEPPADLDDSIPF